MGSWFSKKNEKNKILDDKEFISILDELNIKDAILNDTEITNENLIEKIFYIGPSFAESVKKHNNRNNIFLALSFNDVSKEIYEYLNKKYCILFKGSNGMKLFHNINEYINKEKDL